jgi:hypothetical protein
MPILDLKQNWMIAYFKQCCSKCILQVLSKTRYTTEILISFAHNSLFLERTKTSVSIMRLSIECQWQQYSRIPVICIHYNVSNISSQGHRGSTRLVNISWINGNKSCAIFDDANHLQNKEHEQPAATDIYMCQQKPRL